LAQVAISFNNRTYRFACGDSEVHRLEEITDYLKIKLDGLMQEHGALGDERLILMAALMVTDELFDARADVDELLDGTEGLKLASDAASRQFKAQG
jgi:cell division protein ZapA